MGYRSKYNFNTGNLVDSNQNWERFHVWPSAKKKTQIKYYTIKCTFLLIFVDTDETAKHRNKQ